MDPHDIEDQIKSENVPPPAISLRTTETEHDWKDNLSYDDTPGSVFWLDDID